MPFSLKCAICTKKSVKQCANSKNEMEEDECYSTCGSAKNKKCDGNYASCLTIPRSHLTFNWPLLAICNSLIGHYPGVGPGPRVTRRLVAASVVMASLAMASSASRGTASLATAPCWRTRRTAWTSRSTPRASSLSSHRTWSFELNY